MPVALDKFVKLLEESGLIPREELAALLADIPAPRKADGEQLARELVKRKKLTAYQAQEVYAGRGKKLVLGNYVIHDKLGQGGMGMVLKAEHKRMGRMVALKVMSAAGMANPDAVKRFQREVQAAAKLTHPNIVTAHDADEAAGQHFLVMEYVEGSDLSQLVKKNGPMSVEKALHCILQAAKGLEFAHAKGVVHRDIKPANLLLDSDGTVKILDMGLARLEHSAEQGELTGTGQIMGTVDYMAPEQAMSTRTADARADIYSLGITLWYLLTARVAYDGETLMAKLMAHSSGPIPSLSAINSNVSAPLDAVFKKMIAKTPAERYQSMTEVLAALERCRSGQGDVAPTINLPSEDSKLSEFLHGLGKSPTRSGPASSAASPAAVAAPPLPAGSTNAAFEQTIDTGNPQTDTDPQTQTNLIVPRPAAQAPPSSPPPAKPELPAKPWHSDWRVWTFGSAGLGGALLIVLIAVLLNSGPKPNAPAGQKQPPRTRAPKEPTAWLTLNGKDHYVTIPGVASKGQDPVTLEVWVRPEVVQDAHIAYLPGDQPILLQRAWDAWAMGRFQNGTAQSLKTDRDPAAKTWYHLAAAWDGSQMQFWVNGKPQTSRAPDWMGTQPGGEFYLGGEPPTANGGWTRFFTGDLGPVRVSSTVRYKAEFTPVARWTPDGDTLALYHFDEGSGDVLKDSSGHNHHGKIVGAKWVRAGGGSELPAPGSGQPPIPIPPSPAAVPGNYVLEFDGVDDRVEIPEFEEKVTAVTVECRIHYAGGANHSSPLQLGGIGFTPGPPNCWNTTFGWGGAAGSMAPSDPMPLYEPTHLATVRDGREVRFYVNGRKLVRSDDRFFFGGTNVIGCRVDGGKSQGAFERYFKGQIDEVRVSKSARYDKDFAAPGPDDRFTADADTLALYHFDEGSGDVLKDSSGHNHHGKIVGAKWVAIGKTAPAPSANPFALEFDGKSSLVRIPWQYDGTTPLTLEVWATFAREPEDQACEILFGDFADAGTGIGNSREHPLLERRSGKWGYWVKSGGEFASVEENAPLPRGRPIHVAGVFDGSEQIRFYVNGKLQQRVRVSGAYVPSPQPFVLGGNAHGDGQPYFCFQGKLHAARITRAARYDGDFQPQQTFSSDPETAVLYHFAEGAGEELKDSSGHNRHGKIVGAKWVGMDKAQSTNAANYALSFDDSDYVSVPSFKGIESEHWCIEARFNCLREDGNAVVKNNGSLGSLWWNRRWSSAVHIAQGEVVGAEGTDERQAHVALVRNGSVLSMFVNGKLTGSKSARTFDSIHRDAPMFIGNIENKAETNAFHGTIDELRISKVARYTSDFTPPDVADRFTTDLDTLALYHFDEGEGDVLKDASANHHDGKIVGAKWVRAFAIPGIPKNLPGGPAF